jgi:site-specific DNA recombinase
MATPTATVRALRAALYLRVSPEHIRRQEEDSIERQDQLCRAHCAEQDWSVVAVFTDYHTGAELFERAGLQQARQAALRGDYDVLVTKCVDRFGREPVHQFIVIHELREVGVRVVFVQDQIPDTPEGAIIHHVLAYGAKKEREKILERTFAARKARATKYGYPLGNGKAPFGYAWADAAKSNIVPAEPEASHARHLWALARAGRSLRQIVRELRAGAIPTPSGKVADWALTSIRQILGNPAYYGRYEALRWQGRGKRDKAPRPEGERVVIACPALVDEATYHAVQARLRQNAQGATRNARHPEAYLLRAGFVRCATCGGRMIATWASQRRRVPVYRCARYLSKGGVPCARPTQITAHLADAAVKQYIRGVFTQPGMIRRELERLLAEDPTAQDLAAVDKTVQALEREQANLTASLGQLTGGAQAPIIARLNALAEQLARAAAEREAVRGRRRQWEQQLATLEQLDAWQERVAAGLDGASYAEWREILFACGAEVRIHPTPVAKRIDITLAVPVGGDIACTVTRSGAGTWRGRSRTRSRRHSASSRRGR